MLKDVEVRSRKTETLIALALITATLPIIVGFSLLVLSSFSKCMVTNLDLSSFHFTLENWINLFQGKSATVGGLREDIFKYTLNTAIIALGVSLLVTLVGTMSGYAISRMNFKYKKQFLILMMLLHAFPGAVLIVGVYFIYKLVTPIAMDSAVFSFFYVIVARAALEVPMAIWLMKGFFDLIPWEVEWAAIIDGASRFTVWRKIMLPLIKPGIAAILLFGFLAGWQDLIYVRTFLIEKTLATYIEYCLGQIEYAEMPLVAAAATLYLLPTIIFFVTSQQLLLKVSLAGVKG